MSSEQNYSALDRVVHRVAFASRVVQLVAADVEKTIYGDRYRHIKVERPVFITSLPRAGTTLLLEILSRSPQFAVHLYRDMPFIMAPLLWDKLSASFRKPAVLKERAHGDGMAVGYDSPEAFEEVIWRVHWPEKFTSDGILLWSEVEKADEFRNFLVEHMQKMIALRSKAEMPTARYISKNNANIARIGLLKRLFPDGLILIPFRHPVDQATSLLRQHRKFLALHHRERFSKRYMNDIGHLEFGELHRPIRFDGTDVIIRRYRPDSLDYWMAYWIAAFAHIIGYKDEVVLISYENLCGKGATALRVLEECLHITPTGKLEAAAAMLKPAPRYDVDDEVQDKGLLERARELHSCLLKVALA
ncbi:MAG: sulfotransferase [Beijerinckiaceae bacterium]|nr:sulfotransferase [Beijerinckiaceae bacterium]